MEQQYNQQSPQSQPAATPTDATEALRSLTRFMCFEQLAAITEAMRGEEGEYFLHKIVELSATIASMPRTYETDGQGENTIAYFHYFKGSCDWYITELDALSEQHQAFGLANMGTPELGYISLVELCANGVELDLHWTPIALKCIK